MAVRLKEAVPEKGATQPGPIAAALYQKAKHGIPECVGCGAKLKHTPAYSKHGGRTGVKAHFGLRRGEKHAPGCKYDIDATLRKIVARSREVRDLGATALVEHVGSLEQGTVEFRLHVLLVGLETEEILGRQDEDPEKAYAYQHSKRRLSTYMNCVESSVMVADVVGDDAQLEEKVHVVFNGEKIPWRDFFFGLKEHHCLWRARDKTQGRPVTLDFERRDFERNTSAPYRANGHYQISGRFGLEEGDPPYNVQVQLQVGDKAPDFARWRPGGYPPFAHIILPVRDWSQVFAVGGGALEAPSMAADEPPSHVAPRDAVFDMPVPDGRVPAMGMPPPEAQSSPDVPPVENAPPGGTAPEHSHPEPEQSKPAPGGVDTAGDVPSPDVGEKVSPSGKRTRNRIPSHWIRSPWNPTRSLRPKRWEMPRALLSGGRKRKRRLLVQTMAPLRPRRLRLPRKQRSPPRWRAQSQHRQRAPARCQSRRMRSPYHMKRPAPSPRRCPSPPTLDRAVVAGPWRKQPRL